MGRLKITGERKALNVPFSLKPKHKLMLVELEALYKKNRSKIVQELIEEAYIKKTGIVLASTESVEIQDGTN